MLRPIPQQVHVVFASDHQQSFQFLLIVGAPWFRGYPTSFETIHECEYIVSYAYWFPYFSKYIIHTHQKQLQLTPTCLGSFLNLPFSRWSLFANEASSFVIAFENLTYIALVCLSTNVYVYWEDFVCGCVRVVTVQIQIYLHIFAACCLLRWRTKVLRWSFSVRSTWTVEFVHLNKSSF
jgi:hypothetical protein